jgi:hypothetical protein
LGSAHESEGWRKVNIGQRVVEIVIKGHDASVAAFRSLQANAAASKQKIADLANEVPGLSRALSLVTNPLVAAAAAIVGLATAAFRAAKANIELGASFQDMSNRTELSVESLAKWKFIAEQNGASLDDFERSFRKLRQTMADAISGDAAALKIFETLGVDAKDAATGGMRDLETVMLEIGQAVRQYGVSSLQGAAAQDALGRGSSALVAIIKQQTGALAAQSAEAEIFSSNMTTAWAASADAADDAGARYKFALDNLRAKAMPDMSGIKNAWTELVVMMTNAKGWADLQKVEEDQARAAATAVGEAYTGSLISGLVDGVTSGASSDNSKALADAILGDEDALKAEIAARIKADAEAATQQALVDMASAMAPEATIQVPIKFDYYTQAENVKKETDALLAEAIGVDIDGVLNVPVVLAVDEKAMASAIEEMQIFQDAALSMKYGLEQIGSAAIEAFASGEAGAFKLGDAIRDMVTRAIADAIAKFIVLKIVSMFEGGGTIPNPGGGGGLPAGMPNALGGRIPRAAFGYAVPDGPRGRDSMLIAAMPGEEVINRQLSQRLDRFISSMEFGAAVSPFAMPGAGGGRGNVIINFEVGRPVGVLDALSYGEVAATAARKVAERTI